MYRDRGSAGGGFGNNKISPVKAGDELDVVVEAVGKKGDGMAKKDGFVLFIPNTQKGDKVRIRVTKVLNSAGFAEVIGKSGEKSKDSDSGYDKDEYANEDESGEDETSESGDSEVTQDSEDFGEEEN